MKLPNPPKERKAQRRPSSPQDPGRRARLRLVDPPRRERTGLRVLPKCHVHYQVSRGGTATLHLGTIEEASGRQQIAALKRMLPGSLTSVRVQDMLQREEQIGLHVRHPNVVPIFELCQADGQVYLAMEYVVGVTLAELLSYGQRLPVEITVAIVDDLLSGLHAVHSATDMENRPLGIVHRDVSPQNILIGEDGVARIIDFGLAKTPQSEPTPHGIIFGKVGYLAPEQLLGEPLQAQVDLFSAGIVLWEALTGARLFSPGHPVEHMLEFVTRPLPLVSRCNPRVPEAMDHVISHALARTPNARFESAAAFSDALLTVHARATTDEVRGYLEQQAGITLNIQRTLLEGLRARTDAPRPVRNSQIQRRADAAPEADLGRAPDHGPAVQMKLEDGMTGAITHVLRAGHLAAARPASVVVPVRAPAGASESDSAEGVSPSYEDDEEQTRAARPTLNPGVPGGSAAAGAVADPMARGGSAHPEDGLHLSMGQPVPMVRASEHPSTATLPGIGKHARSTLNPGRKAPEPSDRKLFWLLPVLVLGPGLFTYALVGLGETNASPVSREVDAVLVTARGADRSTQETVAPEAQAEVPRREAPPSPSTPAARPARRLPENSQSTRSPSVRHKAKAQGSQKDCKSAFYFDDRGIKRVKLHCL